ncbi:MAG: tRNA pseudouridine(38-40) synthase TruA, partial [Actinomycetota bacterium]
MRVIRLTLAYDGTDFRGWAQQRDPGVRTVEGSLVEVLTRVVRHDIRLAVAGRTDAGVHARGQVASFLTPNRLAPERMQKAINGFLSPEVVVVDAREAREGFDARFSATAREYHYVIDTAPVADPFTARYVWHRPMELSIGRMREAARHLVGEHDFVSFCRHPGEGKPTVRDLQRVSVTREGSTVTIGFRANAFLHQMVR